MIYIIVRYAIIDLLVSVTAYSQVILRSLFEPQQILMVKFSQNRDEDTL